MDDYVAESVSVDGGSEETKVEETTVETPSHAESAEAVEPEAKAEETTEELYELPDGRKVRPEEVVEEYKKLQSDYTRKSQELASLKKAPITNDNPDGEWVPQTYEEILSKAEERVFAKMAEQAEAEKQAETMLAEQIDTQLGEVLKIDPKVNQNKLFEHATKYAIPNLVTAYKNMTDMNKAIEATREMTAKNIAQRKLDPVAGASGEIPVVDDNEIYDPSARSVPLIEYLRQLKK